MADRLQKPHAGMAKGGKRRESYVAGVTLPRTAGCPLPGGCCGGVTGAAPMREPSSTAQERARPQRHRVAHRTQPWHWQLSAPPHPY